MRVFIAIELTDSLRQKIAKLEGSIRKEAQVSNTDAVWVDPTRIHLTLNFLGEIDENILERTINIVNRVALRHSRFDIEIKNVGTFGRPAKILWVGIIDKDKKLAAIQKELETELSAIGLPKEERDFAPHLTLCRIKLLKSAKRISASLEKFKSADLGQFCVDSVCVYKSQLTSQGPVYTLLSKTNLQ